MCPNIEPLVWCRPGHVPVFEVIFGQPARFLVCDFPLVTREQRNIPAVGAMVGTLMELRRERPDVFLDLTGDVKERTLGRLTGARHRFFPSWPDGHAMRRIVRTRPALFTMGAVAVGAENCYDAWFALADQVAARIGGQIGLREKELPRKATGFAGAKVALQPFASQDCKLWDDERWSELAARVAAKGAEVFAFCGPGESGRARELFGGVLPQERCIQLPLRDFLQAVAGMDLLVGVESFAIHAADAMGVTSMCLVGANPPALWKPPRGHAVFAASRCGAQPCCNRPVCLGTPYVYDCMRAISVDAVFRRVSEVLGASG